MQGFFHELAPKLYLHAYCLSSSSSSSYSSSSSSSSYYYYYYYYYYWYSALGPVWAETRVQSGEWYVSGTLHPGQVLRGSLPLLFPAF